MDENPKDKRSGCGPVACGVIGSMLVLVLYVLSIGPASVLFYHQFVSADLYNWFYGPLAMLAREYPFVENLLNSYGEFWYDIYPVQH